MKKLPFIIFLAFVVGAVITGIGNYKATESQIRQDVQKALAMTMKELPCDKVDADTIRLYRSHITIAQVRDTACIAVKTVGRGNRQRTKLVAEHGCDFAEVLMMSDQRATGILLVAAVLWIMGSTWYVRRRNYMVIMKKEDGISYGGLLYDADNSHFVTADGKAVKLTPMQQQLMEMFFTAENHTLSKQEICDRLWPKKPDASETLYTLIRRLKLVIENSSSLKIESERGRTYRLAD